MRTFHRGGAMRVFFAAALVGVLSGCGVSEKAPASGGSAGGGAPDAQPAPAAPVQHALTISVTGPGAVRSASLQSDCRDSCRVELPAGTVVHLEPAPDSKGEFEAWSGGCAGSRACDVVLSSDVTASAP